MDFLPLKKSYLEHFFSAFFSAWVVGIAYMSVFFAVTNLLGPSEDGVFSILMMSFFNSLAWISVMMTVGMGFMGVWLHAHFMQKRIKDGTSSMLKFMVSAASINLVYGLFVLAMMLVVFKDPDDLALPTALLNSWFVIANFPIAGAITGYFHYKLLAKASNKLSANLEKAYA